MKEIVIISGKGGTGKTSLTASFAALARRVVLADCDVDASDLHLLLAPVHRRVEPFCCGHQAVIRQADCIRCGGCLARCRFDAVRKTEGGAGTALFRIDPTACEGCGVCFDHCPAGAIDFPESTVGEWLLSDTRHGPMVHARLFPGAENSGKLVSKVRDEARQVAQIEGREMILVDGPPGIGCPVIAAITGTAQALVVTEPTLSGLHDLERVLSLARHFQIPVAVCVNKWDLYPELTDRIESVARAHGAMAAGRIRYDRAFTDAQVHGRSLAEGPESAITDEIRGVWEALNRG